MKYHLTYLSLFMFVFAAQAQVKMPPKEKSKENKTPVNQQTNTYAAPAKDAQVVITWIGPGSAKLLFNTEDYFFTEGQEKTLQLKADEPYTLKAAKPDKTYPYSDFVGFNKGIQYYNLSLNNAELQLEKVMSPEEKASLADAKRKAAIAAEAKLKAEAEAAFSASFEKNMIWIAADTFTMGCTTEQINCKNDEIPIHNVTLSGFHICKYEVTQEQWQSVMGVNPSNNKGCVNCPVEQVNFDDIQQFLVKLNSQTGKNFRLPTEAEWEYAARGGYKSNSYKYSGSYYLDGVAWYNLSSGGKTHPVGTKQPNELGLYDMSGNVWEWCNDWYSETYYSNSLPQNPKGNSSGQYRVVRGGSWYLNESYCRSSNRYRIPPDSRLNDYGFRLAQD